MLTGEILTANNLSTLIFYLLDNPENFRELRDELYRLDPQELPASPVEYERIPYLMGLYSPNISSYYARRPQVCEIWPLWSSLDSLQIRVDI
ncbi:hypothetical protein N7476_001809 [Penicillium atrosanguineum]|uniref:Cytochrome P450 n=1 Tax=Penicillium atrosanguineum TaxID=1132637 RepID=A0A9W9U942_9EURO|nr:hypothetical protein N7476_001809 [Penicillium atrosanguineum]